MNRDEAELLKKFCAVMAAFAVIAVMTLCALAACAPLEADEVPAAVGSADQTWFNGHFEVVDVDESNARRMLVRDVGTGELYFYERGGDGNATMTHLEGHDGEMRN